MESDWDIGDGFRRWSRGISQTKFIVTLVRPEILAYVSSCHIKYIRLCLPTTEVIRMFHPGVEGIGILEGNPLASIFAIGEIARKPKISIYKFENDQDMLVSELKGCGENQFQAIRFTKTDLLLALTGSPEYTISVWKWASEHEVMVVNCHAGDLHSDLIITGLHTNHWVEWSKGYLTLYELQTFSDNNVNRVEVALPPNVAPSFQPDPRFGDPHAIDLLSVIWSYTGELFVLDQLNGVHQLDLEEKGLHFVGTIMLDDDTDGDIERIVPYENYIAALMDTGVFLVLQLQEDEEIAVKSKIEFSSRITRFILNPCAAHPRNSFFALTDIDKKVECVENGKWRTSYTVLDLTLSEIQAACFIERDAKNVAVVTERGAIYILDSDTGALVSRWKLPFFAETVLCSPVVPILAVGTADGYVMFVDCLNLKSPKILAKVYMLEDAEIDKLCWTCRGRFLLSGDSQRGHLFLSYGYATMDFAYLDYSLLGGVIVAINVPSDYKDTRIQVLLRERASDEVPFQLNNYKLDCDVLELVASQLFDAPITSMCFAKFKQLLYTFSCDSHRMGMTSFTEDMQAGSLKEPEIQFDTEFILDVNRILLSSEKLYSFGEDGFVLSHAQPAPKTHAMVSDEVIQTHFPTYGGVVDGFLSIDGTQLIAFGKDLSIVHVRLRTLPVKGANWEFLGFGKDNELLKIATCQMKYYYELDMDRNPEIGENQLSARAQSLVDEERVLTRRNQKEVKEIQDGLTRVRNKMKSLLALNDSREESERLPIEDFEVDEEYEELSKVELEQDKQIAEILMRTIIDERYQWAETMKALMWDAFEVKSRKIKGFNYKREISNYPLNPLPEVEEVDLELIVHERRVEKRLAAFENELPKAKKAALTKVAQLRKKRKVKKKKKTRSGDGQKLLMMKGLSGRDADSDSDSDGGDAPKRNLFEELMNRAASPTDDAIDDLGPAEGDEEAETEEGNEEGSGENEEGSQPASKKSSKALRSGPSSKILAIAGSASAGNLLLPSASEGDQSKSKERTVDSPVKPDGAQATPSNQSLADVKRGAKKSRKSKVEEELIADVTESDVEVIEDDLEEEEPADYIRKKKRRIVTKKLHEEDEEEIQVEESDSSEESDSEIERQDARLEQRQKDLDKKLSPEELERKIFIKNFYSGSTTYQLFQPNKLLYDQLEVSNFNHIRNQLKLLRSEVRKLKVLFNEAFEEARAVKAFELGVVQKRIQRVREITSYFNINIPPENPEDNIFEHPETCFEVKDSEVPVPKYMTEEEKRLAELARLEDERRRMEAQEDFRERALIVMMDGVLETRREDMLKRDVPKPAFMLTKEQWEWNPEEYAKANEYFKKVEELEKLRNEFRKELETELRGLIRANSETKAQFDERMRKLYEFKVQCETSIRMEQVKMCRRIRQIMRRAELDKEEDKLSKTLQKLQDTVKSTHSLSSQLAARVEACGNAYESVVERDKNLERTFRSDLGEVGHFYDVFTKLYKKRPRMNLKSDKAPELLELMIKGLEASNLRWFGTEYGAMGKTVVESIYELDEPMQNPIGCPRSIWDRFCRLRREKIGCEYKSRLIGTELMTLKAVLDFCKLRESDVAKVMAVILTKLAHQRDLKLGHIHNVEFQLVLNQGQVELPSTLLRSDFYNALLLNKHLVQACNIYIRKFGGIKLGALNRSKIQHRNVMQIEWHFKKVHLKEKHLLEKKKDINLLRVTKEILEFLRHSSDFPQMQKRRLERIHKLQTLAEQFHRRFMGDQMRILKIVERSIEYKEKDSEVKEAAVDKRNLRVSAIKSICNVQNPEVILNFHRERMQTIMRSAFLMRRIAKNAEEIYFLETELEKLYKKTFPIL